jgi:hypothetical protein
MVCWSISLVPDMMVMASRWEVQPGCTGVPQYACLSQWYCMTKVIKNKEREGRTQRSTSLAKE